MPYRYNPILLAFLVYSVVTGVYFGFNNHKIYHKNEGEPNIHERIHNLLAHVVCSIVGGMARIFLLFGELPLALWALAKRGLAKQ